MILCVKTIECKNYKLKCDKCNKNKDLELNIIKFNYFEDNYYEYKN